MTTKILVLASNPQGTEQLNFLYPELREIEEALERGKQRELFFVRSKVAVRAEDLQRSIRREQANIIHFCGHGAANQGLVLETTSGKKQLLDTQAIADLFKLFADQVKCVVLNACYSEVQAKEISQHINYVIGTKKEIQDKAAIAFSKGFYEALGDGESIERAFEFGCNRIQLEIYDGSKRERKLVPVYSEAEKAWVEMPQHEVLKILIKKSTNPEINNVVSSEDYYVNRPPIEENCFQEIEQEGALLRIKASQKMGKSLLLKKIFEYVEPKNYNRVRIDLQLLESSILSNSSQFLRWLCQRVSKQLKLEDCLEDYWGGMTPNTSCTDYFEEYILESLETPLLLAIDNIDRIFAPEFQLIATDFFGLLRSWWGLAQTIGGNWTKLRLIVIYSTEDLPKLNIYQSPFNIGTEIKLPEFKDEQVLSLAFRYELNWSLTQVQELKEQIGGHPYLVNEAIKNLKMNPELTLRQLLEKAATDEGIYAHHLQHHWSTLEQEPNLVQQLKTIIEADEPIAIAPSYLYKLDSMGLITKVGNQVKPRCQIYRQYFLERLLTLNDC